MMPRTSAEFPELRRAFTAYLHEDFSVEHGTPARALQAFLTDADPSERSRFLVEVKRLIDHLDGLALRDVRELLAGLGSRWTPSSRKEVIHLLEGVLKAQ